MQKFYIPMKVVHALNSKRADPHQIYAFWTRMDFSRFAIVLEISCSIERNDGGGNTGSDFLIIYECDVSIWMTESNIN